MIVDLVRAGDVAICGETSHKGPAGGVWKICKLLWSDEPMNDVGAPDLLDGLLDLSPLERYQAVSTVVLRVWETPSVLLREIPPTQALTAVAVIAALATLWLAAAIGGTARRVREALGRPAPGRGRAAQCERRAGRACPLRARRDRRA